MCGISGIVGFDQPVSRECLTAMRDVIAHRGPDSAGLWIGEQGRVGFGHRRLSIVDLNPEADQPMHDGSQRAVMVFNGEIYNHAVLRKELEAEGIVFQTDHSDSETLLRGYLAWGLDGILKRINGMFAIAIYDLVEKRLILVRDRIGIKPLYFVQTSAGFLFASEIKALLAHPSVAPRLDKDAFVHYLSFRSTPAPFTLFEGIQKLEPGCLLTLDFGSKNIQHHRYWEPLADAQPVAPATRAAAEDQLEALLEDSVALRLQADVPVGVFLSGGLDSGYLLSLAAGHAKTLNAFTVRYPGYENYNEDQGARVLADEAGARYNDVPLDRDTYFNSLLHVSYFQDEPIAAPVCASVFFLARAAREAGVPVVLSGEGSDEVFVGYENWLKVRDLQRAANMFPGLVQRPAGKLLFQMASVGFSPFFRYGEFARRMGSGQPLFWGGAMDFTEKGKLALLGPALGKVSMDHTFQQVIEPLRRDFLANGKAGDVTGWMSYMDLRFRLPELMLMRVDKMGMAASIEGRVPFLDHRIVSFFMGLPKAWRTASGRDTKMLLRAVAAKRLDRDFVYQRKRGFQAPLKEWKEGVLQAYGPMLRTFAQRTGLFDRDGLNTLLNMPGDRLYFSLVNFMMWYLIFIENVLDDVFPEIAEKPWLAKHSFLSS